MNTVDVGGAMYWGATARQLGKTLADNPFPDMPGWYVKRKAWEFGWINAADVHARHDDLSPDDPIYDDIRDRTRPTHRA